ncbi:spore coat polysaccharide synthesis (dTDP-4-dehydrorhamnose epimerase) [Oceanobacillus iheyensis HTE831]|uniref:Spore coat polysaccharide synthesis (dTDP-4-dehydrorhamnose epimerase) n=1 Tax=Oceanobacillus iheyensis (strain DSM 14371 / CIP 107618 / JCM 11309 / KCTC 3954 / HTE831) TaxID=221109 RepID=Q8CUI0_OCEIH|nr:dTDP-4-dehydrorhamnose 3,5-epimerase family protein [Oceanobacillus iheyensis]BAC13083.1 spore coat polysaccharide synthesis (dTDP-4-dehydrorhamnose epimerase) [Oceanobacillus iheyensis HTE831]
MIEGVQIKRIEKHCDDRGYLAELVRDDEHLLSHFGQATISMSYPGVIKAFHYHEKQDDLWYFASGNAQVVLYDLRKNTNTTGRTDVIYMGEHNPILLLIPKGIAHGYRVLGSKPATIIYFTTKSYNKNDPDEKRLAWNDPEINFNWNTTFK